jgi:hypothetical protein
MRLRIVTGVKNGFQRFAERRIRPPAASPRPVRRAPARGTQSVAKETFDDTSLGRETFRAPGRRSPVVTFVFSIDAVFHCRFAISPVCEVLQAARSMGVPARGTSHFAWLKQRRAVLLELQRTHDLSPLRVLLPEHGYVPDFLTPPPRSPLASIRDELDQIRRTPTERARSEIDRALEGRLVDDTTRSALRSRDAQFRLAELLSLLWRKLLEPA